MKQTRYCISVLCVILLGIMAAFAQPEIQQNQSANRTSGVVMGSIVDENNTPL